MIDRQLLLEKLARLSQYVGYLRDMHGLDYKLLETDFRSRGAVERYMHLSIETVIDIGNEIISSLQLEKPERYRDIPRILVAEKIITARLGKSVDDMIGFRNILVHDYARINLRLEWTFLRSRVKDLRSFANQIKRFLTARRAKKRQPSR